MKTLMCVAAALCVGACSPLSALTGAPGPNSHGETLKALGEHIERCDRQYQGGFGLGASFTFSIDCKAQPAPAN
jgi:hypothetical protein